MDPIWPICGLTVRRQLAVLFRAVMMAWINCTANLKPRTLQIIKGAVSVLVALACAGPVPSRVPSSTQQYLAWKYEVVSNADRELEVEASFDSNQDSSFRVDEDAIDFITNVEQARGSSWEPVVRSGSEWTIGCRTGCRVRYRFALRQAADRLGDVNTAIASGNVVFSPASTWLLHPNSPGPSARLEFHVDAAAGSRFLAAMRPAVSGRPNTYMADTSEMEELSFTAFGPIDVAPISTGNASITVGIARHQLPLSVSEVVDWIAASVGAVAAYYRGSLPAHRLLILVMNGGKGPTRGETLGGGGAAILIRVGESVTYASIRDDWVVAHEMLHVNFPDLGRAHVWLTEGLASYVEPIARARAGLLDITKMWQELAEGLPQGLPAKGDRGLELTPTWGRTYWGGALFCLKADILIRERTGDNRSLDDALLAIAQLGATVQSRWDISQVLDVGDRATGTQVLHELYDQLALKPGVVNLTQLFAGLGIRIQGNSITFRDDAPLARIRRSITAPLAAAR